MPKTVRIEYKPFPKQVQYHTSTADELLYGGAAGPGKSTATVMDAFVNALRHPGVQTYLFRRTFPELEKSLILEAQKWCTGIGKYNKGEHRWELPNGSCLWFCHCRNAADRFMYQGAEMSGGLYIDEVTHFTNEIVTFLASRVRAAKKLNYNPPKRYTANPGGIGHAWVKQEFADLEPYKLHKIETWSETLKELQIIRRQYIPGRVTDNPFISKEYIFELERKPPALRKALLEGNWDTFEGQVFFEWRNDYELHKTRRGTHVISPFEIPKEWPRYRSFDWGYSRPFCVLWWAVDPDDRVYLYREWYGASEPNVGLKLPVPEVAAQIKRLEANDGNVRGYADPAIWIEDGGESIARQFASKGVYFNKGDNARLAGKMQLHNRLAFDKNGIPMLYTFSTCKDFIRTIPALVYSQIKVEDVDTAGEDHAYDAARYFLMSRPMGVKEKEKPKPKPYNPLEENEQIHSGFFSA